MLKFCVLRSGSSGNCTLIECDNFRILVDAGMSQKRVREALEEVGLAVEDINAILITHLHSDHLNYSTFQLCNKNKIPLWVHSKNIPLIVPKYKRNWFSVVSINGFDSERFDIGPITIQPFEISHDSEGVTTGFRFNVDNNEKHLTYAADLGYFPDTIIPYFVDSQAVILESNHDVDLLKQNPLRPEVHKQRVLGDCGHLSNYQTADALMRVSEKTEKKPQVVVLCHLSKDHNSPELAKRTVCDFLEQKGVILFVDVAQRDQRTEMYSIE